MTAPETLKAFGCWGSQGGLLSAAEITELANWVRDAKPEKVLEVGHYLGLSTYVIAQALREGSGGTLLTVDHHQGDAWVPATEKAKFEVNKAKYFPEVQTLYQDSKLLHAPLDFDFVFYDGDHADEQMRFTLEVIASPRVKWFVFDDQDFTVPKQCMQILREAGWEDLSPAVNREGDDKADPSTITLGVWRRKG